MGKARYILTFALWLGLGDTALSQSVTPASQTVPTFTWTSGAGGTTFTAPNPSKSTISISINPGAIASGQSLVYRWNVNENPSKFTIRLLDGNGNAIPQNVDGQGNWLPSTYRTLTGALNLTLEIQSIADPVTPSVWDATVEILNGMTVLAKGAYNGRSQRAPSTSTLTPTPTPNPSNPLILILGPPRQQAKVGGLQRQNLIPMSRNITSTFGYSSRPIYGPAYVADVGEITSTLSPNSSRSQRMSLRLHRRLVLINRPAGMSIYPEAR